MKTAVPLDREAIAGFCRRHGIKEFYIFGSVLRDDFAADSDVDVLITFLPGAPRRLTNLLGIEQELQTMFGRRVDVVERRVIEQSRNYLRRAQILSTAEPVYVEG
jgi:hypothetical protein